MSRLTKADLFLIALALAYVLSPVDLIPELITGPLGLTDDMAALTLVAATFLRARNRVDEPVVVPATYTYED